MIIHKVLFGILFGLTVVFLGLQIFEMEVEAAGIRALLIVLLTTLYCLRVQFKRIFFIMFLVTFAIAEIFNFIGWHIYSASSNSIDYMYYIANSLYIISYSFLILQIMKSMNVVDIVKKFPIHLVILIILDVFCVVVVTNTTLSRLNAYEYYLELVYNSVIMILLTVALINYIHKDDKKAINLLMGSIFIFFSEVLQLAYFYISNINLLNVLCSLFLVLAFLFFYLQSRLDYEPQEKLFNPDLVS